MVAPEVLGISASGVNGRRMWCARMGRRSCADRFVCLCAPVTGLCEFFLRNLTFALITTTRASAVASMRAARLARPLLCGGFSGALAAGVSRCDRSPEPRLPTVLESSFSPPSPAFYLSGSLHVRHLLPSINSVQQRVLGIIPPAGDVRVVVRISQDPSGTVTWLRVFDDGKTDGRLSLASRWLPTPAGEPRRETIAGITFAQRLELSTTPDGRVRATLHHDGTSLFNAVPLPTIFLEPHCIMDCHADGMGYDLKVEIRLCGVAMVSYEGRLREHAESATAPCLELPDADRSSPTTVGGTPASSTKAVA